MSTCLELFYALCSLNIYIYIFIHSRFKEDLAQYQVFLSNTNNLLPILGGSSIPI